MGTPGTCGVTPKHSPAPDGFTLVRPKIAAQAGFSVHPVEQSIDVQVWVVRLCPFAPHTIAIDNRGADEFGPII